MPIYEYACRSCGHEFETLVRASEAPSCAKCASSELDKKLSVFSSQTGAAEAAGVGACGTCGHPGGPGSCALS
jgi:putative FmdB family regulatory protein